MVVCLSWGEIYIFLNIIRWIFDEIGCIIAGFIMYFAGCMGIFLMVAISLERLYVLRRPMNSGSLSPTAVTLTIIVCIALSLFWCVMPLFGWSHYSLEVAKTSCSVEWNERTFSVISYNIAMFVFVFIVPLAILIAADISIVLTIKKLSSEMIWYTARAARFSRECNIAYKMMGNVGITTCDRN